MAEDFGFIAFLIILLALPFILWAIIKIKPEPPKEEADEKLKKQIEGYKKQNGRQEKSENNKFQHTYGQDIIIAIGIIIGAGLFIVLLTDGAKLESPSVSIIALILIGLIPAYIADKKGRSFYAWWLFGSLFFVIALIASIVIRPINQKTEVQNPSEGMKKCPYCAELIKQEAIKCRYCGSKLRKTKE